jgi:hypothetical protein
MAQDSPDWKESEFMASAIPAVDVEIAPCSLTSGSAFRRPVLPVSINRFNSSAVIVDKSGSMATPAPPSAPPQLELPALEPGSPIIFFGKREKGIN